MMALSETPSEKPTFDECVVLESNLEFGEALGFLCVDRLHANDRPSDNVQCKRFILLTCVF